MILKLVFHIADPAIKSLFLSFLLLFISQIGVLALAFNILVLNDFFDFYVGWLRLSCVEIYMLDGIQYFKASLSTSIAAHFSDLSGEHIVIKFLGEKIYLKIDNFRLVFCMRRKMSKHIVNT